MCLGCTEGEDNAGSVKRVLSDRRKERAARRKSSQRIVLRTGDCDSECERKANRKDERLYENWPTW